VVKVYAWHGSMKKFSPLPGNAREGYIDALGNVVCPLHRYKFDLKNGRNISGEGYYLKNWPVEIREDGVYVGIEESKLFGLF
jgi:3-phenylpropionate/trans-cinnamate dioxygenase ferredoxin subunit